MQARSDRLKFRQSLSMRGGEFTGSSWRRWLASRWSIFGMVAKRTRRLASRRIFTLGSRNCPQAAAASAMPRSPRAKIARLQPAKTIPAPSKNNASPSKCRACTAHLRSAVRKADGPMQLHARPGVGRKAIAFRFIIISARERAYYLTRPFTNPG